MTPDPGRTRPTPRGWPPELQQQVDELLARMSEGGDLWEEGRRRDREKREREDEELRRITEDYEYWRDEYRRLTRGGPIRRMLRALFT